MTTITKCKCGGRMIPMTDGNGSIKDKCAACGSLTGDGKPTALTGVTIRVRTCTVNGCPGIMGADGNCPCCVKRAAYEEANWPMRSCSICGGQFVGRGKTKYCKACAVVVNRIQVAKAKAKS